VTTAHRLPHSSALESLQKRWALFIGFCLLTLGFGYWLLSQVWVESYAIRWVLLTALVLGYQAWLLWTNLDENHRIGEEGLFPNLGWGNVLSLMRGVMFAALTGFLFAPQPPGNLAWIPALLYTSGALIDFVDGYAARVTNQVTRLGEILDISLDGWGMLVASTLLVAYGQVPALYLVVGWARYLFLAGVWLRQRMKLPLYELLPSVTRRPFAGLQMGFVFVLLWPFFDPPGTYHAAAIFSLPFLVGFLRDWLVVSGTISGEFFISLEAIKLFSVRWLPLVFRIAGVGLMLPVMLRGWSDLLTGVGYFSSRAANFPDTLTLILVILELVVFLGLLLGTAGRIVAIAGLVLLGFLQMAVPLSPVQISLAWIYGAILYLGTGLFSAWKPEDTFIYRRAGE
jgi:CDP-diacylglycerol---glycerol-3-phosphate 3-phosphatidyltransferase